MKKSITFLLLILGGSRALWGITPLDEDSSPGVHALRFKKAPAIWTGGKGVVFDGVIRDRQSGAQTYDRRISGGGAFGFEKPWAPQLSTRMDFRGEAITRRQRMAVEPETVMEGQYIQLKPSVDLTYITPAQLELFVGGTYSIQPKHIESIESYSMKAENRYGNSMIFTPRFGFTRRASVVSGGVYYISGRQGTQKLTKTSDDGQDLTYEVPVYEPTTAAVYAEFLTLGMIFNLEAAVISGSEGGIKSANGSTVLDDHLRIRLGAVWQQIVKFEIGHQTASYARSAYVTLDTIPLTSFRLTLGNATTGLWTGMSYIVGRDKQSIPEINNEYKVDSFVLLSGINRAI